MVTNTWHWKNNHKLLTVCIVSTLLAGTILAGCSPVEQTIIPSVMTRAPLNTPSQLFPTQTVYSTTSPTQPIISLTQPTEAAVVLVKTLVFLTSERKASQTPTPSTGAQYTQGPTHSPTDIDYYEVDWVKLPRLGELVLSPKELVDASSYVSLGDVTVNKVDVTDELYGRCLWDCAKYRFTQADHIWTVTLLRAGDKQKALRTVQNLKNELSSTTCWEYTQDDVPEMIPNSWIVVHDPLDRYYISTSTGVSYGSVVIMITFSLKICWDSDEGFHCEADIYGPVLSAATAAQAQVQKLAEAGYPR